MDGKCDFCFPETTRVAAHTATTTLELFAELRDFARAGQPQTLQIVVVPVAFFLESSPHSEVSLTDSELGELIRYMTQYGEGGFQGRLRRAFLRSVYELLAVKV